MSAFDLHTVRLTTSATIPKYATDGDAGMDLTASEPAVIFPHSRGIVSTGIAVAIPKGYVGLIHPRSGLAAKSGITVLNTPGTIDSGYRGELKVILLNTSDLKFRIEVGDRIAQLVIQEYVHAEIVEVSKLPASERGEGGFGSTGA
jgi:dUTP pyrophosphatase